MADIPHTVKVKTAAGYDRLLPKTSPAQVMTDANNRFVTDAEKAEWNAKATAAQGTAADNAIPKSNIAAATGGTLPIARGGTGATDAATARTNLGVTPANIGAAATSHGNHVPATQTASGSVFLRNDNTWQTVTPANIGAATAAQGTTADNAIPKSNIAAATGGTLPIARGGTGATDAATARTNLDVTPANIGAVAKAGDTMTGNLTTAGLLVGSTNGTPGNSAAAIGIACQASGMASLATGSRAVASGSYSFGQGMDVKASGSASHAHGVGATASGDYTGANGSYTTADSYLNTAYGRYNKLSGHSATAWNGAGNAIIVGNGTATNATANAFRVTFDGKVYGLSAFNASGADYAEWFEWLDGNPNGEDRIGKFVTLDGEKIRVAKDTDDYILGVITTNPSVIGNSDTGQWSGMWLRDEWGRLLFEDVPVEREIQIVHHDAIIIRVPHTIHHEAAYDEDGNIIAEEWDEQLECDEIQTEAWDEEIEIRPAGMERRLVLNPDYDPDMAYIPREERSEWAAVGMLGQLYVYDDGSCEVNGYCLPNADGIATKSGREGYRVMMKRDGLVKIIFR